MNKLSPFCKLYTSTVVGVALILVVIGVMAVVTTVSSLTKPEIPVSDTDMISVGAVKDRISEMPAEVEEEVEEVEESEVDSVIEEKPAEPVQETPVITAPTTNFSNFKRDGVWNDSRFRYTWYSSRAAYHYRTGEWTAGSDGIYRDSAGYVVVASNDYALGTVIDGTLFGTVKVYDCGCASGTLDVYVSW